MCAEVPGPSCRPAKPSTTIGVAEHHFLYAPRPSPGGAARGGSRPKWRGSWPARSATSTRVSVVDRNPPRVGSHSSGTRARAHCTRAHEGRTRDGERSALACTDCDRGRTTLPRPSLGPPTAAANDASNGCSASRGSSGRPRIRPRPEELGRRWPDRVPCPAPNRACARSRRGTVRAGKRSLPRPLTRPACPRLGYTS